MPIIKVGKAPSTVAESIINEEREMTDSVVHNGSGPVNASSSPQAAEIVPETEGTPQLTEGMTLLKPVKTGLVTSIAMPFDIYGTGPIHIMFLTALGLSRSSWMPQIDYFARKPEYSCLVIDIRGFDSFTPHIPLRLSGTKQHARELKRAIEDLGWNLPKSIHVMGFSMGGMIALQMGRVCSEYIASIHLVSTAAKYKQPPPKIVNIVNSLQLLRLNESEAKAESMLDLLFPPDFLYAHDPAHPDFKNNRERFLSKETGDLLFAKKQNAFNYYEQTLACARHSLSQANLWEIAAKVRYLFVSGADSDFLFHPDCAKELMVGLNSQGRMYAGGHMIPWQFADELNADEEAMIQRAHREYQEYPPTATLCWEDIQEEQEPIVVSV